jgi:hypothetical protein
MNTPKKEARVDTLERALIRAHEAQEAPHFPPDWTADVMRDIRRQASRESSLSEVPRVVWRAAAVVAIVSTLFVGSVLAWTAGQGEADFTALLTMATADSMLSIGEP